MEILDSETESNKPSIAHQLGQTATFVEISLEEAEIMDLKKRLSLRGLIANRGKGATLSEAPKAHTFANLPPAPPPPPVDQGPRVNPDPMKKKTTSKVRGGGDAPTEGREATKDERHL